MFAQLNAGKSTHQRGVLATSVALHGLLFAWLLHAPELRLLNPTSVAPGHNGKVVTQLYFPTQSPDDSPTSSSDRATERYRHQRLGHEKLVLKQDSVAKLPLPQLPRSPSPSEDNANTTTLSKLGHGAAAG